MAALSGYLDILRSVFVIAVAFYVLERFGGAFQARSERLANYLYLPFSLASISIVQVIAGPPLSKLLSITGGGVLSRFVDGSKGILGEALFAIGFAIVWDIWQYWVHRWQHASPLLWQIHKLHHSDTNVTSSTQARNHPLNYLYLAVCYAPMLALFGAVAPHALATVLMFRVWGFVNHANVRFGFGPLTGLIAGPQWHRIHHSIEERHLDKNFAAYFPFIDRMFGTYYRPLPDEYPATGLVHDDRESFIRQASISPLVGWSRALAGRTSRPAGVVSQA